MQESSSISPSPVASHLSPTAELVSLNQTEVTHDATFHLNHLYSSNKGFASKI